MIIEKIIEDMITYNKEDRKRINHAIKVYTFSCLIASNEVMTESELFILKAASVLHDIGIHNSEEKYHSCSGKYQEIEGPPVAREILRKYKLPAAVLERILFLISKHHSYQAINGIDFQILIEADFIVNNQEEQFSQRQRETIVKKYFKTESGMKLFK
ncbi:MAG: HD domain-containing protein [Clostridia bacterium]|nr:HD domain-containing protein [Clostridia bacterium]